MSLKTRAEELRSARAGSTAGQRLSPDRLDAVPLAEPTTARLAADARREPSNYQASVQSGSTRSRADLDYDDSPQAKRQRKEEAIRQIEKPRPYYGNSQRELTAFIRACKQVYDVKESAYRQDRPKVIYARGFLRNDIQNDWYREEERIDWETYTWAKFKSFLQEALQPAAIREVEAFTQYLAAYQKPNQTVAQFASVLDELESKILPVPEKHRAIRLMVGLKPAIRKDVSKQMPSPDNRKALLELAIRSEHESRASERLAGIIAPGPRQFTPRRHEGDKQEGRRPTGNFEAPTRSEAGSSRRPPPKGHWSQANSTQPSQGRPFRSPGGNPVDPRRRDKPRCDFCHGFTHRAQDCRKKAAAENKPGNGKAQ